MRAGHVESRRVRTASSSSSYRDDVSSSPRSPAESRCDSPPLLSSCDSLADGLYIMI